MQKVKKLNVINFQQKSSKVNNLIISTNALLKPMKLKGIWLDLQIKFNYYFVELCNIMTILNYWHKDTSVTQADFWFSKQTA